MDILGTKVDLEGQERCKRVVVRDTGDGDSVEGYTTPHDHPTVVVFPFETASLVKELFGIAEESAFEFPSPLHGRLL